jgi:hypothetical protein
MYQLLEQTRQDALLGLRQGVAQCLFALAGLTERSGDRVVSRAGERDLDGTSIVRSTLPRNEFVAFVG